MRPSASQASGIAAHNGITRRLLPQRWQIWTAVVLAHSMGMFHRAAMAPVGDRVMGEFGVGAVAFGALGASYFYIYAAMQLPSGMLADTLGPRKTITGGLLVSSAGSILMAGAPSFGLLVLGRVLVSFGVSVVWLSLVKTLMEWFRSRELATITGLSMAVSSLGQIAATVPLALLVMWADWRLSFAAIGLLSLGLAVSNWLITRDRPLSPSLPSRVEIEGEGIRKLAAPGSAPGISAPTKLKAVLGNRDLWPLFLMGVGTYGAFATLFNNWSVIYVMQTYGVRRDSASNFVLVASIGVMIGGPLVGAISDRVLNRRRLPAVIFIAISLVSFLLLTFWDGGRPPIGALYPICFFIGFGTGALPITFALVRELTQPETRGTASGLVNMGFFVGAALVQPLFGYILDLGWQGEMLDGMRVYPLEAFQRGLILCCGLVLLGLISCLLARETHGTGPDDGRLSVPPQGDSQAPNLSAGRGMSK